jgi:hypothetical protein
VRLKGPMRPIRLLRAGIVLAGLAAGAIVVSACAYLPRTVDGVPAEPPWVALPLRMWLAEGRAEPEAVAICRPPDCAPAIAIAVVRLTGPDAAAAEAVLNDPERLARALRTPQKGPAKDTAKATAKSPAKRPGRPIRTVVSFERFEAGSDRGFFMSLAPSDGSKRPAFGAALGHASRGGLHVVLVIGSEADAVEAIARRVAETHRGS